VSKEYSNKTRKPQWQELAESAADVLDKVTSAAYPVFAATYSADAGAQGIDDIPFDDPRWDKLPPQLKRPEK